MWVFIENELFDGVRIPPPPNLKATLQGGFSSDCEVSQIAF